MLIALLQIKKIWKEYKEKKKVSFNNKVVKTENKIEVRNNYLQIKII